MIVKVMIKKDPDVFQHLSRSTVEHWIERDESGRGRWSDSTLAKVEKGNHTGHDHGGRKGILVRRVMLVPLTKLISIHRQDTLLS